MAWRGVRRQLVAGAGHDYFPSADHGAMYGAGLNLEQLGYAVLLVVLGVYAWRRLGAPYGLFVLGSLALPFSDPVPSSPLLSMPRFALGVFPVFLRARNPRCATPAEHGVRLRVRPAARDQPRTLGALALGRLIPRRRRLRRLEEDGERSCPLGFEARLGDVAEVLAVGLQGKGPVAAHLEEVEVVAGVDPRVHPERPAEAPHREAWRRGGRDLLRCATKIETGGEVGPRPRS